MDAERACQDMRVHEFPRGVGGGYVIEFNQNACSGVLTLFLFSGSL